MENIKQKSIDDELNKSHDCLEDNEDEFISASELLKKEKLKRKKKDGKEKCPDGVKSGK